MTKEELIAAFVILECELGCSLDELKSSYRQLVKVWHPDRFETDSKLKIKANEKMKLINEAYQLAIVFLEDHQTKTQSAQNNTGSTRSSGVDSSKTQLRRSEFADRSEQAEIKERINSNTGQKHFEKEVVVKDFEGEFFVHQRIVYRTRLVPDDGSFFFAAKDSAAFHSRPEDGIKSRVPRFEHEEGLRTYDTKYSFPDGSEILVCDYTSLATIFSNNHLKWSGSRSALNEIIEDYKYFEKQRDWKQCVLFAQKAIDFHAKNVWGWVHRSFALHCLSKTKAALRGIDQAVERFPKEILIHYNAACYYAQLEKPQESKDRLKAAFELARKEGRFDRYYEMSLNDSDLSPIRSAIPQIALVSKISRFF